MKKIAFVLAGITIILSSCEVREDLKASRVPPNLKSNSPVAFGEELRITTANYNEDHFYEMTFPWGYTTEANQMTYPQARFSNEGLYVVTSYDDQGLIGSDSVIVDIIAAAVPCTPAIDKLTSPTGGVAMDFYFVSSRSEGDDQRRVYANSSNGDFDIIFNLTSDPDKESTFISKQQSGFNTADEVSVSMNLGGSLYWGTPGQYVHVQVENGKTYITLCDFEMSRGTTDFLISTRLELD